MFYHKFIEMQREIEKQGLNCVCLVKHGFYLQELGLLLYSLFIVL